MARYAKFVEWSAEDGCFIGRCPALFHGGVHGADEASVYKDLCTAVEEWIESLHRDGKKLPPTLDQKKYSGKFQVRLEPELHRRVAAKAQAEGESLNTYIQRKLAKT